jgi:hypothetical protein
MRIFLAPLLRWLASLSWTDFVRVVGVVASVAEAFKKEQGMTEAEKEEINSRRATHVREWIATHLGWLKGWQINAVLELAVGWFNRTKP